MWWNTRHIKEHFNVMDAFYDDGRIDTFVRAMGWTYAEYRDNVDWVESLIRGYYNDEEVPLLWYVYLYGQHTISYGMLTISYSLYNIVCIPIMKHIPMI